MKHESRRAIYDLAPYSGSSTGEKVMKLSIFIFHDHRSEAGRLGDVRVRRLFTKWKVRLEKFPSS